MRVIPTKRRQERVEGSRNSITLSDERKRGKNCEIPRLSLGMTKVGIRDNDKHYCQR